MRDQDSSTLSASGDSPPWEEQTLGTASRVILVIVLELTLLLAGSYGAWYYCNQPGGGTIRARIQDDDSDAGPRFGKTRGWVGPPGPWLVDPAPELSVTFNGSQQFSIELAGEPDPNDPPQVKKLTSTKNGNLCVTVDGDEHLYGQPPGDWGREDAAPRRVLDGLETVPGRRWLSVWEFPGHVRVEQTVMIIPGRAKLDAVLVHYLVENRDTTSHDVGLRYLLDTHVGTRDGVPFAIPGNPGLLTTRADLRKNIPDFIQALERPDNLDDGGLAASLGLRFPVALALELPETALEPMDRVWVGGMPTDTTSWDWKHPKKGDTEPIREDLGVAIYWNEDEMGPKTRRAMAFTYGLGNLMVVSAPAADAGGNPEHLALSYAPTPQQGGEFTILAWIKGAEDGQNVTLELPEGMTFVGGQQMQNKRIQGKARLSQTSWRVKVDENATPDVPYSVSARTGTLPATVVNVMVKARTAFRP